MPRQEAVDDAIHGVDAGIVTQLVPHLLQALFQEGEGRVERLVYSDSKQRNSDACLVFATQLGIVARLDDRSHHCCMVVVGLTGG